MRVPCVPGGSVARELGRGFQTASRTRARAGSYCLVEPNGPSGTRGSTGRTLGSGINKLRKLRGASAARLLGFCLASSDVVEQAAHALPCKVDPRPVPGRPCRTVRSAVMRNMMRARLLETEHSAGCAGYTIAVFGAVTQRRSLAEFSAVQSCSAVRDARRSGRGRARRARRIRRALLEGHACSCRCCKRSGFAPHCRAWTGGKGRQGTRVSRAAVPLFVFFLGCLLCLLCWLCCKLVSW